MRKIDRKYDNIVDNMFIDVASLLSPLFKKLGFSPNMITGINIYFSMLCIYHLYLQNYNYAVIYFLLSYFFDTFDGFYARKYNMETEFGNLLDHYTDYIFFIYLYYLLLFKIKFKNHNYIIIIIIFLTLTSFYHLACTEHYTTDNLKINGQLKKLKYFCTKKEYINMSKFFGPGTLILSISIILLYYVDK